jgi:glycosyltransferase involved in cell wall biosynthesis
MPKVSVIITTYNYGHMLAESIDSVLGQDYADFELIVVDDGSTDDTAGVAGQYKKGDASLFRYIRQDHAGIAVARNTGIAAARGELIAFQDADDVWAPNTLALRVRAMERHPELGMVFGDAAVEQDGRMLVPSFLRERKALAELEAVRDGDDLRIITQSAFPALLRERFIPIPTIIIPKRRFDELGPWDPSFEGVEDYEFYLRLSRRFALGYIDRVLVTCRIHGANVSCDVMSQNERRIRLLRRFENDPSLSPDDRRSLRHRLSEMYMESAWHLSQAGLPSRARLDYLRAWSRDITNCGALLRYAATLSQRSAKGNTL